MSSGERPIGTANGKQPNTEALCQTPQHTTPWEVHFVEVIPTTFGPNLAPKAPGFFLFWYFRVYAQNAQNFVGNSNVHVKRENHLEERL